MWNLLQLSWLKTGHSPSALEYSQIFGWKSTKIFLVILHLKINQTFELQNSNRMWRSLPGPHHKSLGKNRINHCTYAPHWHHPRKSTWTLCVSRTRLRPPPQNPWGNDWVSCNDGILEGLRQNLRSPGFHQLILCHRMVFRKQIWHQKPFLWLQLLPLQTSYMSPAWPHKLSGCLRFAYQPPLMPNLNQSFNWFIISSHPYHSSWHMLTSSFPKVDGKDSPHAKKHLLQTPNVEGWHLHSTLFGPHQLLADEASGNTANRYQ